MDMQSVCINITSMRVTLGENAHRCDGRNVIEKRVCIYINGFEICDASAMSEDQHQLVSK